MQLRLVFVLVNFVLVQMTSPNQENLVTECCSIFLVKENAKLVTLGYQMFIHLIKIMNTSHIQDTSAASIYKPCQSFSRILATMHIERRKKEREKVKSCKNLKNQSNDNLYRCNHPTRVGMYHNLRKRRLTYNHRYRCECFTLLDHIME